MLRQLFAQKVSQLSGVGRRCVGDQISNQLFITSGTIARDDYALADRWMFRQRHFDFAQLDPKAAQLHLLIAPAGKSDLATLSHARPIAGPIESRAASFDDRMRNKQS